MSLGRLQKDRARMRGEHQSDALIVGAGIAGIYSLFRMKRLGLAVTLVEAGGDLGGTWYWNRYPGARCDVDSVDYSFSFSEDLQQEWHWPERYSTQADILEYLNHVVDRFDLRHHCRFNKRVGTASYDEVSRTWRVCAGGDVYETRYLILATGLLSATAQPAFEGLDRFVGSIHHTSNWTTESISFNGHRVGVIGTGSSGIQVIPEVAREAKSLTVFQRTANYIVPAQNSPTDPGWLADYKARYAEIRAQERNSAFGTYWSAFEQNPKSALAVSPEERDREYERRWSRGGSTFMAAFIDLLTNLEANRTAAEFVRRKIVEIVKDPDTARKLLPPEDNPIACRRLCVEIGYFEAFNRKNVRLVDLRVDPITCFDPEGIRTRSGLVELDAVIMATGFDAMTGAVDRIDIRGCGGVRLTEKWADGPRNLLGILTSGFPNLMTVNGPLCAAGNFMTVTEVAVDWIADIIRYAEEHVFRSVDATLESENFWVERVKRIADQIIALQAGGCSAWFTRNIPGKPRIFLAYMGGLADFAEIGRNIAASGYRGINFAI